ncbi:MAG: histidine kinase [Lachnospiraceae bacterium]|nr:histidine kinase [Lachnospiraceae bacterium]MCI8996790.1 histidine kinase [Lachnospiraceae bacterium]MCI9134767.1 histidine kinase [Lachnospiraceae bacterium]
MKDIAGKYHNLPVFYKILIWMLAVSILPFMIMVGFIFTRIVTIETSHCKSEIVDNLRWIENRVTQEISDLRLQGIRVSQNDLVYSELSGQEGIQEVNVYEVKKSLFDITLSGLCHSAYIVGNQGLQVSNSSSERLGEIMAGQTEQLKQNLEQTGKTFIWGNPIQYGSSYLLPYVRFIKGRGEKEPAGLFIANFSESRLADITRDTMEKGKIKVENVLILSEDMIFSSWNKELMGKTLGQVTENAGEGAVFDGIYENKKCMFLRFENASSSDWQYVAVVSYKEIHTASRSMILLFVPISIFCVCFILLASYLVSHSISKPLEYLSGVIRDMGSHDLNIELKYPAYRDEVGQMWTCLVDMKEQLKKSMEESKRTLEQNQRLRIEALRAQINPHFLYNTFGSIIYLIEEGKKKEATDMLAALSELLHISISPSADYTGAARGNLPGKRLEGYIQVEQELSLIRKYMDIQKIRYQNTFRYLIDVDMDILKLPIVKIILQPVVENALEHGLKMSSCGEALLVIRGWREGDLLIFEVQDNCKTLTEQRMREVNDWLCGRKPAPETTVGIGLKNVNDRICYEFPEDERLGVRLERRGGNTVTRVVVRRVEDDHV